MPRTGGTPIESCQELGNPHILTELGSPHILTELGDPHILTELGVPHFCQNWDIPLLLELGYSTPARTGMLLFLLELGCYTSCQN